MGIAATEIVGAARARACGRAGRVLIAAGAVALVAALAGGEAGASPRPAVPAVRGQQSPARLPIAARAAISRVVGREDRSYRAVRSGSRVRVTNRRDGLVGEFGRRIQLRAGKDHVTVSLRAFGRGSALRRLAGSSPDARANRVLYRRGPLTEWYTNGPLGLEQGFTVATRPRGRSGPLTLQLAIRGPGVILDPDARGLRFRGSRLRYIGLTAADSTGRVLPARLEPAGDGVRIRVDDRRARYPVTVDPLFTQQAVLTASDGQGEDRLGVSIAVSGDTVVAGAELNDHFRGAAYVFVKPAGGWAGTMTESAKLIASDGEPCTGGCGGADEGDWFGSSVGISGDTIVVGAVFDDIGTNVFQGSAYVFQKPPGGWAGTQTENGKLTAAGGQEGDVFGISAAISGDTIVVGADERSRNGPGSAYVFTKPAGGWVGNLTQNAKLTASDPSVDGHFGVSVALDGDTIVVGALADTGAAYVYSKPAGGWSGNLVEDAKLTASDGQPSDALGAAVAISGGTIVAGAPGRQNNTGAAYVFIKPASGWQDATETAELTAAQPANDNLGASVAAQGTTVVAGGPTANVGQECCAGAVYVFVEPPGGWHDETEAERFVASDHQEEADFGSALALSGATLAVGAVGSIGSFPGEAYVFGSDTSPPTTTITLDPPAPNGADGWYTVPVHVTVSASDDSSGVAETRCVLDPATPPPTFDDLPAGCPYLGQGGDVSSDGEHTVYAASRDEAGNAETPVSRSFKIDTTPPTLTCAASPDTLWPPDHRLVPVTTNVFVSDAGSGATGFTLASAVSDQPDSGPQFGPFTGDVQDWTVGTADTSGELRAERYGTARTYTLTYQATDAAGNTTTCAANVRVPGTP
jgi:FG-GAP repeat